MLHCKNQSGIPLGLFSLCIILSAVLSQPSLLAQGIVAVASNPTEVAKTNRSVLSGTLLFTVTSGSASPGEIVINYGIPIEGIGVVSDGSRMSIEPTALASGILTVRILEEINNGEVLTLSGVRLDVTATDAERVMANLSVVPGSDFFILERYRSVEVISRFLPGLEVDLESDLVFILPASSFQPTRLTLALKEGFPAAFSGNTGQFGQNVPTRVQIRVVGLPERVSVIFPDSVPSSVSEATLSVLEGSEPELSTGDENLSITYEFSPQASRSDRRVETFQFDYTVKMETPDVESTDDSSPPQREPVVAEPTTVFLQATLAPGESETCNGDPCVPRYRTEFLPPEDELPLPEFETYFPINPRSGPLKFQFTNRRDLDLTVHLEALGPDGDRISGPGITNPASVTVDRSNQVSVAIEEVFGTGILDAGTGTAAAMTRRADIGAIFLLGDDQTLSDAGRASQPALTRFLLSNISREGEEPFTVMHFFNPSEELSTEISATLYDSAGEVVSSIDRSLGPRETISESAEAFFAADLEDFQDGYIQGTATGEGVVAAQMFGNEETVNYLAAQATPLRKQSYGIAHIAFGGGLETELNLINSDKSRKAKFRVSVFDDQGQALLTPMDLVLETRKQRVVDLSDLFGLSSADVFTGSLEIELRNAFPSPFLSLPSINGSVRFKGVGGRYSTAIPLFRVPDKDALYAHVAQDQGLYTGVAIKNRARGPVDVTVEAFDASGYFVGNAGFTLSPGARMVRLLSELIPETAGQRSGGFRVLSPGGAVESFALFGDQTGDWISTIPGE